jgi:hypothetical protein
MCNILQIAKKSFAQNPLAVSIANARRLSAQIGSLAVLGLRDGGYGGFAQGSHGLAFPSD